MSAHPKIAILFHPRDKPHTHAPFYMIWYLIECWKMMGFQVQILKGLPTSHVQCDLLVAHIDLTKIPDDYSNYIQHYPAVLNGKVTDISKRTISRNLVSLQSDHTGPVIVKTDNNYGGIPEYEHMQIRQRLSHRIYNYIKRQPVPMIRPGHYPVYDRKEEVPQDVWKNRNLVVEKFIPERHDDGYCIRVCHFLGDIVLNNRVYSKAKVIKGSDITSVEPVEIPEKIAQVRKEMGFDFGKFDYVVHNGEVHILDMNKTPGVVNSVEINKRVAEKLAQGIWKYIS